MVKKKLKQSSAGKKKKDKKGGGKKQSAGKKDKSMSAKKRKDMDELSVQIVSHALKSLREDYHSNCKRFISEPILGKVLDKAVSNLEHIDRIILNSIRLTFNDVYALTTTFEKYDHLNFLCLWMTKLDLKGVSALAKFFAVHPKISTLHILDCGLTPESAPHLASMFRESQSLRNAVLDHNPIGSKGASHIFIGIKENKTPDLGIQRLSLRYCEAGPECAESLSNMLMVNNVLLELDLTGNALGDTGLKHLGTALGENKTLQVLSMAANGIAEKEDYFINKHILNAPLSMNAGFPQYTTSSAAASLSSLQPSPSTKSPSNPSFNSGVSGGSVPPPVPLSLDSTNDSNEEPAEEQTGSSATSPSSSAPASANTKAKKQKQLALLQQQQEALLAKQLPGLISFCTQVAQRNMGLAVLDLRGNHFGNIASKIILDMLMARKQACSSRKAAPLIAHITERINDELFDRILDLNDVMNDLNKKNSKKKK